MCVVRHALSSNPVAPLFLRTGYGSSGCLDHHRRVRAQTIGKDVADCLADTERLARFMKGCTTALWLWGEAERQRRHQRLDPARRFFPCPAFPVRSRLFHRASLATSIALDQHGMADLPHSNRSTSLSSRSRIGQSRDQRREHDTGGLAAHRPRLLAAAFPYDNLLRSAGCCCRTHEGNSRRGGNRLGTTTRRLADFIPTSIAGPCLPERLPLIVW